MSNLVVAIDGPAASGKSSVARMAAALLNCVHVDSGSLYRGFAWHVLRECPEVSDAASAVAITGSARVEFYVDGGAARFTIDGADPGNELRSEAVQKRVSEIATLPQVRTRALELLRGLTDFGDLVMEGRDIGTVVFPETPFKFYLDADAGERARRRHLETSERDGECGLENVRKLIVERDSLDSGRNLAPLKKAPDALVIDTTRMTIEEVGALIVRSVKEKSNGSAGPL